MALAAVLGGIAAVGSIVSTVGAFLDAKNKQGAIEANFSEQMRNIQERYAQGVDQIAGLRRQGESFISTQRVSAATTGVSGSVDAAIAASQGYLERDISRAQRQLDYDRRAAERQAQINRDAGIASVTNQRLGAVGSLLSNVASLGIQGYNAGLLGGGGNSSVAQGSVSPSTSRGGKSSVRPPGITLTRHQGFRR